MVFLAFDLCLQNPKYAISAKVSIIDVKYLIVYYYTEMDSERPFEHCRLIPPSLASFLVFVYTYMYM